MKGDLGYSTQTNRLVLIAQGQTCTLLCCTKSRNKVKLLNFKPSYVKVNEKELKETSQVRVETMFPWNHLAKMVSSFKISLLNIRSWNCHIAHFLAESIQFDVLQRQLMMSQTLEMLTVLEMIENCFSNLLVMTLPFNIKPLRFPFITHSDTTSFIQSR